MPDMWLAGVHPVRWLGQRDRGFAALRRATRAAIIMPAMFALGDKVIGNPQLATFAAFGSFAMLLLVDFGGSMAERFQAQAALAVTGGVFVCLATLASQTAVLFRQGETEHVPLPTVDGSQAAPTWHEQ